MKTGPEIFNSFISSDWNAERERMEKELLRLAELLLAYSDAAAIDFDSG